MGGVTTLGGNLLIERNDPLTAEDAWALVEEIDAIGGEVSIDRDPP